jgi:hypothetical protein
MIVCSCSGVAGSIRCRRLVCDAPRMPRGVRGDQLVIDGRAQDRLQYRVGAVAVGVARPCSTCQLRMSAARARQRLVIESGQDALIEQRSVQRPRARLQVAVGQPRTCVLGEGDRLVLTPYGWSDPLAGGDQASYSDSGLQP